MKTWLLNKKLRKWSSFQGFFQQAEKMKQAKAKGKLTQNNNSKKRRKRNKGGNGL